MKHTKKTIKTVLITTQELCGLAGFNATMCSIQCTDKGIELSIEVIETEYTALPLSKGAPPPSPIPRSGKPLPVWEIPEDYYGLHSDFSRGWRHHIDQQLIAPPWSSPYACGVKAAKEYKASGRLLEPSEFLKFRIK